MWLLGSEFNTIQRMFVIMLLYFQKSFFIDKEYRLIIQQTFCEILEQIGIVYYFILKRMCQRVLKCVIESSKLKFQDRCRKLS